MGFEISSESEVDVKIKILGLLVVIVGLRMHSLSAMDDPISSYRIELLAPADAIDSISKQQFLQLVSSAASAGEVKGFRDMTVEHPRGNQVAYCISIVGEKQNWSFQQILDRIKKASPQTHPADEGRRMFSWKIVDQCD